jgi:hypothetical protein
VPYFYAIEHTTEGFAHLHALVAGTAGEATRTLAARWDAGFTRIVRYDPQRGAAHYVSKRLMTACGDEYGVSKMMPPVTAAGAEQ